MFLISYLFFFFYIYIFCKILDLNFRTKRQLVAGRIHAGCRTCATKTTGIRKNNKIVITFFHEITSTNLKHRTNRITIRIKFHKNHIIIRTHSSILRKLLPFPLFFLLINNNGKKKNNIYIY